MRTIMSIFILFSLLPKADSMQSDFVRMKTSICSFDFFKGFFFTKSKMEFGVDRVRIINNGDYKLVRYAYAEGKKDGEELPSEMCKYDFATLVVELITPVDGKENKHRLYKESNDFYHNVVCKKMNIGDLNVYQHTYYLEFKNSSNVLVRTYFLDYVFLIDNVYVDIRLSSQKEDISKYQSTMQKVVQSFKLEKNTF